MYTPQKQVNVTSLRHSDLISIDLKNLHLDNNVRYVFLLCLTKIRKWLQFPKLDEKKKQNAIIKALYFEVNQA